MSERATQHRPINQINEIGFAHFVAHDTLTFSHYLDHPLDSNIATTMGINDE
jgi:hypothetical protein